MAAYIQIKSGPNTYYYTGSSPASAYAAFRQQTGRTGSFTPINQAAFNSGLAKFGYTPQGTPAKAVSKPVVQKTAPIKTADQIINERMEAQIEEFKKKTAEYDAKNPFAFDEELAKNAVLQEISPFYDQKLSDFLQGIESQRGRSVVDEQNLLADLKADTESYTGRAKMELDRAVNASREGFSDAGLFFSGRRLREEGGLTEESQFKTGEFMRGQQIREREAGLLGARTREDLERQQRMGQRDILREKGIDVAEDVGVARRREGLQSQLEKTEFLGQAPGETFTDFLGRQQRIETQFLGI